MSKHKPRSLDEADVDLELAIQEATDQVRRYCQRLPHGRVDLAMRVTRYNRVTIACEHKVTADSLTGEDIERIMAEKPTKREVTRCR